MLHVFVVVAIAWSPSQASGQANCPAAARNDMALGWQSYRGNNMPKARAAFQSAQRKCPDETGVWVGLAYLDLRNNSRANAEKLFDAALRREPRNIDALVGRGISAWRGGDLKGVRIYFKRVQAIDPQNTDAREYLARVPERAPPPVRSALVRSDIVLYNSRVTGDHFEVRTQKSWEQFYVKGINLSAALPGKHPSEFPDSGTYAKWLTEIGGMGVNAIRVYTIHPPYFYGALAAYNRTHSAAPLWLVHGVWTELPPKHNFDDKAWEGEFVQEMRYVVNLLHGRADIPPRAGHASGYYTADVSQWVLAYIIGREWEPFAVGAFNSSSGRRGWHGRYLELSGGTPADAWMTEMCETMIAIEMKTYNAQHPVAYTNWPTLDPLAHPTETSVDQEVAIRMARGDRITERPKEYDNDRFSLDANLVHPTAEFLAGWFVSYHAYPYYPDFFNYDPGYSAARSSQGPSNYFGYLQDLKRHHPNLPIVISEYGVPASIGVAHIQPQGWNHGGMSESAMALIDARLTREIAEAGMAGGMLFAWIDEWFKKNWIVIDFEIPLERNRLWHNRLDAEQHYGMVAMEAVPPVDGSSLSSRMVGWKKVAPLYRDGGTLRAASDASYLWLLYEPAPGENPDEIMLGFDVVDAKRGDTRWPGQVGDPLTVGLEFVLRAAKGSVQLLADDAANPWRILPLRNLKPSRAFPTELRSDLPGYLRGRFEMKMNSSVGSAANADGRYSPLFVAPNRRRLTKDSSEIPAAGYDRGMLREGEPPDGLWERLPDGTLEVRIPWMLINFTDPSQRRVLDNQGKKSGEELRTSIVPGIRITARITATSGQVRTWPGAGVPASLFSWPVWEEPKWISRTRSVYDSMRTVFSSPPARPIQ